MSERMKTINIESLIPFKNHPFKNRNGMEQAELIDSIRSGKETRPKVGKDRHLFYSGRVSELTLRAGESANGRTDTHSATGSQPNSRLIENGVTPYNPGYTIFFHFYCLVPSGQRRLRGCSGLPIPPSRLRRATSLEGPYLRIHLYFFYKLRGRFALVQNGRLFNLSFQHGSSIAASGSVELRTISLVGKITCRGGGFCKSVRIAAVQISSKGTATVVSAGSYR